ncbi:hypothetical protein VXM60_12640 [Shewanella khirikhana]|uniref:hypothetical protein n=1 Tax=Shewanella khirikhana TaxID=1965282 RepID=UPI0030D50EEE
MYSKLSVITHQWLLCSALLMLAAIICLPAQYWPLVLFPLICIGKECWHVRSPGRLTLTGLFGVWLGCFAIAIWA